MTAVEKKGKKFNTMETQCIDPNDWDHPEFKPMTAWRVDRMKDMTYTQLWFLIREHKVDKASPNLSCPRRPLNVISKVHTECPSESYFVGSFKPLNNSYLLLRCCAI